MPRLMLMIGLICQALYPSLAVANAGELIEKAVQLIEDDRYSLARSYLAPALIDPRLPSDQRSRAYYLRGFSFAAQDLPVSALRDFNRALEFNPANPAVLFALARLYWDGRGADQDEALALSLFAQADELGHSDAALFLALGHLHGRGAPKDITLGENLLTSLADAGDASAMEHLAGHIRAQQTQPKRAAVWYRKAFAAGNSNALVALAYMHLRGELQGQDALATANRLLQEAALAGSSAAMTRLAHHYMSGTGLPLDYAKALSWFLRASALGDANADVGLGYLVDAELVDDSELQPAEYWYRRAAMANSVEGQLRWARWLLANGEIRQATTWFAAAANQNHAQGHNDLAWLLATQRNAALRNGSRALSHARLAVQAEASVGHLDTLAAALAETGQFEQAVATQQRAIAAVASDNPRLETELQQRLDHYRRQQPWRE